MTSFSKEKTPKKNVPKYPQHEKKCPSKSKCPLPLPLDSPEVPGNGGPLPFPLGNAGIAGPFLSENGMTNQRNLYKWLQVCGKTMGNNYYNMIIQMFVKNR